MLNTWIEKLGLGKDKGMEVKAPMAGKVQAVSEVGDPVFKEKLLGDGVAILPSKGRVVAPVDGTISLLFETKHAVSIKSVHGIEILIHVGLDTVKLQGEHFKAYVQTGDMVRAGDLLLEFELDKIRDKGYDLITPMVICNTTEYSEILPHLGGNVKELDKVLTVKR